MQNYLDPHLVSAFVGVIRKDRLYYSNAGHPYPIIINQTDKDFRVVQQNGSLLGVESGKKYENGEMKIKKGETVLLYTDGLMNPQKSPDFETKIGNHSIANLPILNRDPQAFIERIVDSLRQDYEKNFEDDASIMAIVKR